MDKFFKIRERGSNVKLEIIGGLTTFFAMAYIIFVNPAQVAAGGANGWLAAIGADGAAMGQIWNAVYIASILVAIIGTLLMALYARMPFAQACGMGLNAFFCTCFVSGAFFAGGDVIKGYQSGLVIILLSGFVFLILSVTGARSYIARSLPDCLKKAIPAGIGLFIALIGCKNANIIQSNQYTFVQFFDFKGVIDKITGKAIAPEGTDAAAYVAQNTELLVGVVVALFGLLLIGVLAHFKKKGAVIISIFASAVLYYLLLWKVPSFDISQVGQSFKDFGAIGITGIFSADSWNNAFNSAWIGGVFNAIVLVISFCLVDMFDTIGTLYGTASEANMLDANGDPINCDQAMVCDSVGTVTGAVLGTSTCTTFVESSAGVAAGARTGFASIITAACFAVCLFLSPLASIIPSCATAPALIYVGILMLRSFTKIDMSEIRFAIPAFLALFMMPLTYSISNGIGIGAISYTILTIFTGKFKKTDIIMAVISVLFIFRFLTVTM